MVAIYLRKSRGDIEDLEKHKQTLVEICNKNNWKYDIYEEIGSSVSIERVEFNRLIENIDKYNKILVMALDRLSRDELGQATIFALLKEKNIEVVTPIKKYDFQNESDIMVSDFEKLLARQEYRMIRKRLLQGKMSSFKQGNWTNGFPPIPYVYNRTTKSLDIDSDKLKIWEQIKRMALDGYSPSIISEKLGLKTITVRRLLSNKVLLGYVKYKDEYIKGNHLPVISESDFIKIQNYKNNRTNGVGRTKHIYPLSGLIFCTCGHRRSITRRVDRNNIEVIQKCRHCGESSLLATEVHQEIKRLVYLKCDKIKLGRSIIEFKIRDLKIELSEIERKIKDKEKDIETVIEMIRKRIYDMAKGESIVSKEKTNLKKLKEKQMLIQYDIENVKSEEKDFFDFKVFLKDENLSDSEINEVYKTYISKIIIKEKKVERIVFK